MNKMWILTKMVMSVYCSYTANVNTMFANRFEIVFGIKKTFTMLKYIICTKKYLSDINYAFFEGKNHHSLGQVKRERQTID